MVGWANSSLRRPQELPRIPTDRGHGVVCEDPLECAMHPSDRLPLSPTSSNTAEASSSAAPRIGKGGLVEPSGVMPKIGNIPSSQYRICTFDLKGRVKIRRGFELSCSR